MHFFMKKAMAGGLFFFLAGGVQANSTTLTITGTITNKTCEVDADTTSVTLDTVDISAFKGGVGIVTGGKAVNIKLKNCTTGISKIKVTASGTGDNGDTSVFLDGTEGNNHAKGVGIYFIDGDDGTGSKYATNGSVTEEQAVQMDGSGNASLSFYAEYVSTSETVIAGSFSTAVMLKLEYE